jgi:hypothetical protein
LLVTAWNIVLGGTARKAVYENMKVLHLKGNLYKERFGRSIGNPVVNDEHWGLNPGGIVPILLSLFKGIPEYVSHTPVWHHHKDYCQSR